MYFLNHSVHKQAGAPNVIRPVLASWKLSYNLAPYNMLRRNNKWNYMSQYSVGSQELNISALVIESWQPNTSQCQCGQHAGKTKQEHSIWHVLHVSFVLMQRSKIGWWYSFRCTSVVIKNCFKNNFLPPVCITFECMNVWKMLSLGM